MALAPRTVQNTLACVPHAGPFETGANHSLASGFDDARADKQVLAAKVRVARARGIGFKVGGLAASLFENFRVGGKDGTKRAYQLFDFSLVEPALLVHLHPGFLGHGLVGM